MIETTPEGYKVLIRTDGSREFMIDSDRIEESITYIRQNDLRHIGINSFIGYKKSDIGFLADIADFVEGITIPESRPDISILNGLRNLKSLGFVDNKKTVIDLSNFPDLTTLACDYSKRLLSLESCEQLKELTLSKYRPKEKNLLSLPRLSSLSALSLFSTNIESFLGIASFPVLRRLSAFRAPNLTDIRGLADVKNTLAEVEFDQCKRIDSYTTLGTLTKLRKLILSNCSAIRSLSFVNELESLQFLSFVGTNVIDGDLSPTLGIGYVGFDDRRHYSHSFQEVSNRSDFSKKD